MASVNEASPTARGAFLLPRRGSRRKRGPQSKNRYQAMQPIAVMPSFQVIFFPDS